VALLKGGEHAFGGRHDPARECVSGSGVLNGRFVLSEILTGYVKMLWGTRR